MKKINNIFLTIIFLFIIIITPLFIIITKDKEFSENENRYLSSKPKFSFENIVSGKFFKDAEEYINDQFIFREKLYEIKTQIQILIGNKDINGVYLAEDNYLIEKHLQEDFDENILDQNIESINKFAEQNKDKNIDVMIVPTASLILQDKLPENAPIYDQNESINKIKENITNCNFIDLRETLFSHKEEYIYYKTDHHWTSLGAYYAYETFANKKGKQIDKNDYEIKAVTNEFKGTLYSKILYKKAPNDIIEIFKPKQEAQYKVYYNFGKKESDTIYDFEKINSKDKYQVFFGGNYPEIKISTENINNKNLLIIKDSYANSFIPFLLNDYENICVIDLRYFKEDLEQYINDNKITNVLILYNIENFSQDETIKYIG